MTYGNWENFFKDWKAGNNQINGWSNPDNLPLYNTAGGHLSSAYVPEPWWGNDGSQTLHSVVINFNPGAGDNDQLKKSVAAFTTYADLVNSDHLPLTRCWHCCQRAVPILMALRQIGANLKVSLKSHLSVELIPWHTKGVSKDFYAYCSKNLDVIFNDSIQFAAEQSRRIANDRLKNKVIMRMSEGHIKWLLRKLEKAGYRHNILQPKTGIGNGCYITFTFDKIKDVKFICIWGPHSYNKFPPANDLRNILKVI